MPAPVPPVERFTPALLASETSALPTDTAPVPLSVTLAELEVPLEDAIGPTPVTNGGETDDAAADDAG